MPHEKTKPFSNWVSKFKCWWASYSTFRRPSLQQLLDIFGLYKSNYKVAPSLPSFHSHSFKTIQTEPFLRARPPGAVHPHPDLFPGSETMASVPPLNPDIKQHQQNTTWLPRHGWHLHNEKRTFFPHKQNSKSRVVLGNRKNKQGLFLQWFFVALAAKVPSFHLLVPNGELPNRWKNRLSWSLLVNDVKKFDRFQITSVVKMNDYCALFLSSIWCFIYIYIYDVYLMCNYSASLHGYGPSCVVPTVPTGLWLHFTSRTDQWPATVTVVVQTGNGRRGSIFWLPTQTS